MKPRVLYLSLPANSPSHIVKLAGIRRYCAMRGWEAEPMSREEVSPETLPALLRRHRPVGCVVDGIGRRFDLLPRLFRQTPVVYIGYPPSLVGNLPTFNFNTSAIVETAFRELSAGKPSCYAAVGFPSPLDWSRSRIRAFRSIVRAAGAQCAVFPGNAGGAPTPWGPFVARLSAWLADLPEHCAVFAVSDETAALVTQAARAAGRAIPASLTLVSVDNFTEICETADPPISSIQLDFERQGFVAARALDAEMSRRATPRRRRDAADDGIIGPLLVVRRKSTGGRGRREHYILDALEMIRREACEGLTARGLIARFPASKPLFNLRFREATGHSVLDEIQHVRLEKACSLLARTDTAIGAIPALCGFRCNRTLDALFRSRFGMSMRDWRKRHSGPGENF